jgi:hypothetical protein
MCPTCKTPYFNVPPKAAQRRRATRAHTTTETPEARFARSDDPKEGE